MAETKITSQEIESQQSWISASYNSGWGDYDAGTEFGGIQYMKDSLGFIHMRGLAKNISGSTKAQGDTIVTLPVGYRSTRSLIFCTLVGSVGLVRAEVRANGTIVVYSTVNNTEWVSFAPISYKAEA